MRCSLLVRESEIKENKQKRSHRKCSEEKRHKNTDIWYQRDEREREHPEYAIVPQHRLAVRETAREYSRRWLHYAVARWGHSPSVLTWELFNEVEWTDAIQKDHDWPAVVAWHNEMAAFVRSLDPYHHLVTTSSAIDHPELYATMDYYQPHAYPREVFTTLAGTRPLPGKPWFYAESGRGIGEVNKDEGMVVRDGLWAGMLGGLDPLLADYNVNVRDDEVVIEPTRDLMGRSVLTLMVVSDVYGQHPITDDAAKMNCRMDLVSPVTAAMPDAAAGRRASRTAPPPCRAPTIKNKIRRSARRSARAARA